MNSRDMIRFSKATFADAASIAHLVNSAYRGDSSKQGWTTEADFLDGQRTDVDMIQSMLEKPNQWILLAKIQNRLVGCILLEKLNETTCYFGLFAIDPLSQGQGIGRALLDEVERCAYEVLKCQMMEMTVLTIREDLIPWYERLGYKKTGETRSFPNDFRYGIPLRDDLVLGVFSKRLG